MKRTIVAVTGFAVIVVAVIALVTLRRTPFPELRGPYLGQRPPGRTPERFAPGVVSSKYADAVPVFSPDGIEVYWSRLTGPGKGELLFSRVENGVWTAPRRVFAGAKTLDAMPSLTADGKTMLFISRRPAAGTRPQPGCFGLWTTTRSGDGWAEPTALPAPINVGFEDFSVLAADGTLYFSSWRPGGPEKSKAAIFACARTAGGFGEPLPLPAEVWGEQGAIVDWVSADQRTLIYERPVEGRNTDLYVSFRGGDDAWGRGVELAGVNSGGYEHFASVSPDGRYLFFSSDRGGNLDVYWVDASLIEAVRPRSS